MYVKELYFLKVYDVTQVVCPGDLRAITVFFKMLTHSFWNYGSISQNSTHTTTKHTHTTCKTSHTSCKSNTCLKTILTLLKMIFLHCNSTHKHKIISHIHAKLHTDVKNVKHYTCVSFACSECSEAQEFVIAHTCTYTLYIQYARTINEFYTAMQLNWINTELTWDRMTLLTC